jgi:hypothetical protein
MYTCGSPVLDSPLRLCVLRRPRPITRRGVPAGTRPGSRERRSLATQGGDMFWQLLVYGLAHLLIVMTVVLFQKGETW